MPVLIENEPDNIAEIIAQYASEGVTLSLLEKQYGHTRYALKKWFAAHGVTLKDQKTASREANKREASPEPTREQITLDYKTMSLYDIQRKYHIGQSTLYHLLDEYCDERKTHGEACSIGRQRSFIEALPVIENLEEQYAEMGYNKLHLANKHNLSRAQINALFEAKGIQTVVPWRSSAEISLYELVCQLDPEGEWTASRKDVIAPFELDMYSERRSMAIEYCGLYWHSEASGKKDSRYHVRKHDACAAKGVRLLTVFESDDTLIFISMLAVILGKANRLYARECVVKKIDNGTLKQHENDYHLAGHHGAKLRYGLYHKDELVSTMTFGVPRFSKGFDWEIIRYTVKTGYTVIGGAEKLFAQFKREVGECNVMTFSDARLNTGAIYERLGFKLARRSPPNYWYHHPREPLKLIHRSSFQKHKLTAKLEHFDERMTEWENMKTNGYDRIWDCGSYVYINCSNCCSLSPRSINTTWQHGDGSMT